MVKRSTALAASADLKKTGVKGGSLTLVKGAEGGKYCWATITEESYKTLLSSACVTGEQSPVPVTCVSVLIRILELASFKNKNAL
jgi:hypothetical protein